MTETAVTDSVTEAGKGARYRCTRCGACCRWEGYVHITPEETDRIAEFLGISVREFLDRHTRLTDLRTGVSLTEKPDGACIFFSTDGRCLIQDVKPKQCRDFPNEWNFPDFLLECSAVDTWEEGEEQ